VIGDGGTGYCGLRQVRNGKLVHVAGTPARGFLEWYRDPLPTNCVAQWVCGAEKDTWRHNLAVVYRSCTADCLFCQNWRCRSSRPVNGDTTSADELAEAMDDRTHCVCFFGGDPSSQMAHALATAKRFARRGVRVCWETNGTMHPKHLERALDYAIETGGCVKFDLKAFGDGLHRGLTGVSNRRTLENFEAAASRFDERTTPPPIVASTLLVPGYVDSGEVEKIARFIARVDRRIPYALLAFAPAFRMSDLPRTTTRDALEAEAVARDAGLANVRIGNTHLLGLI
jgi:pyruvate formate lyase activating enzyme